MCSKSDVFRLALAAALAACAPISMAFDAEAAPPAEPVAAELQKPDIAKGEEKSQVCIACHGERGISQQDNYPHLHGQRQTYLLRQMRNFRDGGDRRDPIMTPMLENMTDQDLVNLAAYYASFGNVLGTGAALAQTAGDTMATPDISGEARERAQPQAEARQAGPSAVTDPEAEAPVEQATAAPAAVTAPAGGDAAAGQTKSAACAACHGADGRGTTPLFPNLNGQKPDYLMVQLKAFRDGRRTDPTMAPMAMALSDQDIADLAVYYSGLK